MEKKVCKTTPFTESGECSDEVEFIFDDDKRLYVSQNFLKYVSPVFKAMFEHNFKEKENNSVKMTGKKYEDVLEFLLCLHPNVQKSLTKDNVFSVVHIADEYQAELMITRCQEVMSVLLESELTYAQSLCSFHERVERARNCLRVLSESETLQYKTLVNEACKVIAHFGHAIFTGTAKHTQYFQDVNYGIRITSKNAKKIDPIEDCKNIFDSLSIDLRYKLLQERLNLRDNLDMHGQVKKK